MMVIVIFYSGRIDDNLEYLQKQLYRMFRAIPTNNKLCFDKQLKRTWRIHQQKLRNIKSSISKTPPQHYGFLDQRAKRAALDDVRNMQIQKQNHSLLTKIKCIGQKGSKTACNFYGSSTGKKKTLNEEYRKRELVKIVEENQDIIKRIQSKKSMYNVKKWSKQRKQIEKNITLISSFPYKNYPPTQTKVNLWMTEADPALKQTQQAVQKSRIAVRREDLLFNGTHKIGQDYYFIETKLMNKTFVIQIENLEIMKQKYKLQLNEKEAMEMIEKSYGGKLRNLFNYLEIDSEAGTCELKCFKAEDPSPFQTPAHIQ